MWYYLPLEDLTRGSSTLLFNIPSFGMSRLNSCSPDQGLGAQPKELASRVLIISFGRFSTSSWLLHHVQYTRIVPDLWCHLLMVLFTTVTLMFSLQHLFFHVYSCFLENSLWCDYYIGSLHCMWRNNCKNNTFQSSGDIEEGFPVLFRSCFVASLKALSVCFSHQSW